VAHHEEDTAVVDVSESPPNRQTSDCLVVIYDRDKNALGKRFVLKSGPLRIGRLLDNEVVLDDDAVSRRHARIEYGADGWFVADVGSRNGTLLNSRQLAGQATLRRDDRIKIGSTIFKYLSGDDVEAAYLEEIYQLGVIDHLTGVNNRRNFDDACAREFSRARRHDRALSLLMIDIDYFKQVNDRFGHPAGDEVLQEVARALASRLGSEETIARYGGEEFAILLPEARAERARRVGEKLRAAVERLEIGAQAKRIPITISVGVAELARDDRSGTDLVRRADEALYAAKHAGRNRVVLHPLE
jgi:two-component system cell cycle response regulator